MLQIQVTEAVTEETIKILIEVPVAPHAQITVPAQIVLLTIEAQVREARAVAVQAIVQEAGQVVAVVQATAQVEAVQVVVAVQVFVQAEAAAQVVAAHQDVVALLVPEEDKILLKLRS